MLRWRQQKTRKLVLVMSDGGTDIDTDGAGDAMAMMVMTTRALYK